MNSEIVNLYSEFKQYRRNFKFEEFDNDKLRDFLYKFESIHFSIDEEDFLKYKINSTVYYIKKLLKYNIPFSEYIRNTIGTDLMEIPYEYICDLHKKILHKFSGFGIDYKDVKAVYNFLCKCDIPNYIDKLFSEKDIFISKIASVIELPNLNNIDIEFIDELNHCIQNNSFLKLSNGEAIEDVLEYYKSNYFLEDDAQIESRFVKFLNNPFYTANLCVYCPALLKFKHINDSLSSDEKVKFLKHIYSKPLSYSDLKKYCSKNFQLRTI